MPGSRSKTGDIDERVVPLGSASPSSEVTVPWRPAPPHEDESVRWECDDGRWVAIGLATGERAGLAFVLHSGVLCQYVEDYDAALALAKKWRTI